MFMYVDISQNNLWGDTTLGNTNGIRDRIRVAIDALTCILHTGPG